MKQTKGSKQYVFNVDIMLEAESNAKALELIVSMLNQGQAADYLIRSGITIGSEVEAALKQKELHAALSIPEKLKAKHAKKSNAKSEAELMMERIQTYISTNKLVRLIVNKGRGIKLSVPCRIISFDTVSLSITAYHVDEKQVYSFSLNEIDDLVE